MQQQKQMPRNHIKTGEHRSDECRIEGTLLGKDFSLYDEGGYDKEQADFIVQACNAFDQMRSALQFIVHDDKNSIINYETRLILKAALEKADEHPAAIKQKMLTQGAIDWLDGLRGAWTNRNCSQDQYDVLDFIRSCVVQAGGK